MPFDERPSIMERMMKRKAMAAVLAVLLLVIAGELFAYYKWGRFQKEDVPAAVDREEIALNGYAGVPGTDESADGQTEDQKSEDEGEGQTEPDLTDIPKELNLKAAFYPQAPYADWDLPWQEACEEASVLLVANEYLNKNWSRAEFRDEILKLVEWEKETFGDYEHTSVDQTARILEEYLDLKTVIHENPTLEDVKSVLARGNFIVMTFAGKKLGNPNYRNGGPNYHALLVKGYKTGDKIITHDVGTRNGEDYVYSWTVIENALHDYAEPIEDGEKRMIEVLPPVGAGAMTDETANNQ